MSKKKKIVIISIILVVVAIGVGLLIYFLNPKPDFNAPYEDYYEVVNNKQLNYIDKTNDELISYMTMFEENEDPALFNNAKQYIEKYKIVQELFDNYKKINFFMQSNILYLTDYDDNLVDIQRKLTDQHKVVLNEYEQCVNYINEYIKPLKTENHTNSWDMFNVIKSYDKYFINFINEYSNFYLISGELFDNYATLTINSNPYTKQNILSITKWSNKIVENVKNNKLPCSTLSMQKLKAFTSSVIVSNPNSYYNEFEYFNGIVKTLKTLNDDFYTALADDNINDYYNNFADGEEKTKLNTVITEYFMITLNSEKGVA